MQGLFSKMMKYKGLLAIYMIFVAIYLTFAWKELSPVRLWMLLFITIAWVMLFRAASSIKGEGNHSAVYEYPIATQASIYLVASFLLGVIFAYINDHTMTAILLQIAALGIYLATQSAIEIGNAHSAAVDAIDKKNAHFIKSMTMELKLLSGDVSDPIARHSIERFLMAARSASADTIEECSEVEGQIMRVIEDMKGHTDDPTLVENKSKEGMTLIKRREEILRINA